MNPCIAVLVLASSLLAQNTGAITGIILSAAGAGAPVAKAQVRAKNVATGATASAVTASNGTYTVSGLAPGRYELSIEALLFIPFTRKDVQVAAGQPVHIDAKLDDVQLNTLGDGGEQFAQMLAERPAPKGRTPRTPGGKPDFTGVWFGSPAVPLGSPAELLPWAEEETKRRNARMGIDGPQPHCLPLGLSLTAFFSGVRLVQNPKILVILGESWDPTRQIYLDGRTHPKNFVPSWMGHSVGRWDKDVLVVDTVGFNDRVWVTFNSYPQTEQMHITERFSRPDLGHLEIERTFDDPGTFNKPWQMKQTLILAPADMEVPEVVCENNRDLEHLVGR